MKLLIVGLGSVGQRHVRNLRRLLGDSVDLLAYRTRGLTQVLTDTQQVAAPAGLHEQYGLRVFTDLEAALAEQPTAAFICNPNNLHIATALTVAQAGCHLFIEKPLSHNLDGVSELIALVERQNLTALVAFQLRFHPVLRLAADLLRAGRLGRVLAVRAENGEYMPGWHPYEDYRQTYAAKVDGGGGVVLTQSHELDYLYWLFGRPQRVMAMGGHLSDLAIEVEDVASVLLECQAGETHFPVHLHLDYIQRPPRRGCQIIGEAGRLEIDLAATTLRAFWNGVGQPELHEFPDFQRNQLFLDEVQHFLACLRGEAEPVVSLRDGVVSLQVALAIRQSLAQGQVVPVDYAHAR